MPNNKMILLHNNSVVDKRNTQYYRNTCSFHSILSDLLIYFIDSIELLRFFCSQQRFVFDSRLFYHGYN